MENFASRKDLLSATDLRTISRKSDGAGLLRLASHLLLVATAGAIVALSIGSWLAWPAYVLYGTVLAFLFAPLHESIHGTAFHSKKLNLIVSTAIGFILFLPAKYFRTFHFAHHRYTNDADNDPELALEKPSTLGEYCWAMTGIPSYWLPQLKLLASHAAGNVSAPFIPQSHRRSIIVEARVHIGGYLTVLAFSYFAASTAFLHFWIVPLLFGMIALRGFLLAEHAGCELSGDMLRNTRTTVSNPLFRFLSWNMPYHAEHHVFPSVPFHQLPELHGRIKQHVSHQASGYLRFHRDFIQSLTQS